MLKTFTTAASATLLALMLTAAPAQAGGKHNGGHGGGHGHGGKHRGHGHGHFKGHFAGHFGHDYCFTKKVKVWDPYEGYYYWDYKVVCPRY